MTGGTTRPVLLIEALADSSASDWGESLGDEVRFRSPYADYAGPADVAHLLDLIREVLVDVRPVRTLHEQGTTISLFRRAGEGGRRAGHAARAA